mgnify:CR=1 FL=1
MDLAKKGVDLALWCFRRFSKEGFDLGLRRNIALLKRRVHVCILGMLGLRSHGRVRFDSLPPNMVGERPFNPEICVMSGAQVREHIQ